MWVKVDGVTSAVDAKAAVDAGVSAVGMIFAPSVRKVNLEQAEEIRAAIPSDVMAFGVFDDSQPREVGEIAKILSLDGVQFPAPLVAGRFLGEGIAVLRTVRVRSAEDLLEVERLLCDAVHLDSYVEGQLGGTGEMAPIDVIAAAGLTVPFVISGGLNPSNVASIVSQLSPTGVDVSSGVERGPGVKDHDLLEEFVQEARRS